MNETEIGEASRIAELLKTRADLRGYRVTAVLFGHNQVVVQYQGGKHGFGQFVKKIGTGKVTSGQIG